VGTSVHSAAIYAPVTLGIPLKEVSVVQTGPGRCRYDVKVASAGGVGLLQTRNYTRSVGVNVLRPGQTGFVLPLFAQADCVINGDQASSSAIHMPGDLDSAHIRGGPREILGVVLPKQRFVHTVAALLGVGPEDVALNDRMLALAPEDGKALRRRLTAILDAACRDPARYPPQDLSNEVFALMADAYLMGRPERGRTNAQRRPPERIVRMAEERFAEAGGDPISLADLCAATDVGKSRLHEAFQRVCGEPPLGYFRKRQLMLARSALLDATPARGTVKRVAMDSGLTELGRFSVEYRRIFGESPSATLNAPAS
jgi:AraC-like DNA-binding protein